MSSRTLNPGPASGTLGRTGGKWPRILAFSREVYPPMGLSRDEVSKVAVLARLRLGPDELEMFTGQLNTIVEFVAQLQELDVTNVEPLAHGIEIRNVFREDVRGESLSREAALSNAPKRNPESFLVPAVLE